MSRAKKRTVVACAKHGRDSDAQFRWLGKSVPTNPVSSKRDRFATGCPLCKAEGGSEKTEAA